MNIKHAIQRVLTKKQNKPEIFPAVLGDVSGVVKVNGKPGYVYVRVGEQTLSVFNARTAPQPGLPVFVGYDPLEPDLLQVLSVRLTDDRDARYGTTEHHKNHEFPGGNDIVYMQLRQIMPWRITPAGGLKITVYRAIGWTQNGYKLTAGTLDLAPYRPVVDGKACYVLITVDNTGIIRTTKGDDVDVSALSLAHIPQMPEGTAYVLGAVRLYALQTQIQEAQVNTDIVDLRFPMKHTHTSDEAGGHDPVTVVDSTTIDLSITDQQLTASVIPSGIKLDSLGEPDDTTNLNATTQRHGLLPKLPGSTGVYLRGDGTWAIPSGSGGGGIAVEELDGTPSVSSVTTIRVSNGTLTDEGNGVIRLATGGGSLDILAVQVFS